MAWLNLNQSLSSLKGQITNFASEVLSEPVVEDSAGDSTSNDAKTLEDKCRNLENEISALKKLNAELEATLQSQEQKTTGHNGLKEEDTNWYWDPPTQPSKQTQYEQENQYQLQIRRLQDEISTMKERNTIEIRPETDEEVRRLREENKNLTTNLDDLDSQHQQAMESLLSLKKELQKNFELLKQEHEDLKSANDDYSGQIKHLLTKIEEKNNEIDALTASKSDYDTLHHKYLNLERVHSLLKETTEQFQEENQDLHEEIFKLQEQVTKLEHDLEIVTKTNEISNTVPREKYEDVMKELKSIKERRNNSQIHLDESNIDDNAKSVIENLKSEISDLKHKLSETQHENHDILELESKLIKPEKIMQLYNKYVTFELPVDYVGEMPSVNDNIIFYKLESIFKTLKDFHKDNTGLQNSLSEKYLSIEKLQTHIDELTTENDFLTSDIQHLERELIEMKKNNDFLLNEISALKNSSKLEPIIESHEDNLVKLETELADCNKINKTFESDILKIEKELNEVNQEKNYLKESLKDIKNKYSLILDQLDMCKSKTKVMEDMENAANADITDKVKKVTDEVDELKKRINSSNAKNEQLSIDLHISENEKVLLLKQVDDLKHLLENKSTANKTLEAIIVSIEKKLKEVESKKNESVDTELDKLKLEKDQLSIQLEQYTKENLQLQELVSKLQLELEELKERTNQLKVDNLALQNDSQRILILQKTVDEQKNKIILNEKASESFNNLKQDNKDLLEKKLLLETELIATDKKIIHLEEEFEKLLSDMNEKDKIIDTLNSTIAQNNESLLLLNQSIELKDQQINKLSSTLLETKTNLEDALRSNETNKQLENLLLEQNERSLQIAQLDDEIKIKNSEIIFLQENIKVLENSTSDLKLLLDDKNKEINSLTNKIQECENVTITNDNIEKETTESEYLQLNNSFALKCKESEDYKTKCEQLEKVYLEHKTALENSTAEKTELINLITSKHNESIQYHNEIQRLNHVLLEQAAELKRLIEEKNNSIQNSSEACVHCENLRITLKEKDNIIMTLHEHENTSESLKLELVNATETVKSLSEKCENLDKSLTIQLERIKTLTAENAQLSEKEQNSTRELERLRDHLMETEESYTQELMAAEKKLDEWQAKARQAEDRAKQSSTVYTSNSIRANQEVETLRNQIKLLEKQRDEVQTRLSEADDTKSRSEAAVTNLQVVLEQFQLDKEREVHSATEKIRNKMEDMKRENVGLQEEIAKLNAKLQESLAGLQAAARLGDQVETKSAQIKDLKDQVKSLQSTVKLAEEKYHNTISNQQDKIDKNLVKNLVINYILTAVNNASSKGQVLRLLSTVLDFNQQECEKLGLNKSAPVQNDSLAAEFVKFLQNESKPRPALPNMMGLTQGGRGSAPSSRKTSVAGAAPLSASPLSALNATAESHRRTPSGGSGSGNLLLQSLEAPEPAELSLATPSSLVTGVTQTRSSEGAILKHVLKDM